MNNLGLRHSKAIVTLHWLTFFLIIGSYLSIELRTFFERGTETRELMKYTYFVLGLSILSLTILRLFARYRQSTPSPLSLGPNFLRKASLYGHFSLYLFLLLMPILGWLILSAEGKSIMIFGMELPLLIEANKEAAEFFEETHELVGKIGYFLIGGHVALGLFHHFKLNDNALSRISFQRRSR